MKLAQVSYSTHCSLQTYGALPSLHHRSVFLEDMQQLLPKEEMSQVVWVSREVLRLGRWDIGDPVIITMKGRPVVKTAWPYKGKSIMGAFMIRESKLKFFDKFICKSETFIVCLFNRY